MTLKTHIFSFFILYDEKNERTWNKNLVGEWVLVSSKIQTQGRILKFLEISFFHRKQINFKSLLRGKIILGVRFMMSVYWTIGWCYRLANRKWPQIPYIHKNITLNGIVIDSVTAVEDIWFNDTTCEIEYQRDERVVVHSQEV